MSTSAIYSTEQTREQYTQYLQDQLEKLSSFMLYQKKENQKYNQLTQLIEDQNEKIMFLNDKVLLLELYQNQSLKNQQKFFNSFHKTNSFEKRITHLEQNSSSNSSNRQQNRQDNSFNHDNYLISEVQNRIEKFREEIASMEHKLTRKLSRVVNQQEPSQGTYSMKLKKNKHESSNNMSPLETNYSQHGKSQINEFAHNIPITQRQIKQKDRKVSTFSNEQKPSTLQQESTQRNHNKVPSIHTEFRDTSMFAQHQNRSPISKYLKKQNEYNSSNENANLKQRSITTKQFYSACEINPIKQQKAKSKRTHSRSKSRSKSNRSVSKKSNKFKTIETKKVRSKKIKVSKQKKTSNNTSRISQISLSQATNKSRSRSKSYEKMFENQKKYLMNCKKIH